MCGCLAPRVVVGQTIALVGGAIETLEKTGRIESGVLVLQDGKIKAVGADAKAPETAQTIDVTGKFLMPGIVDPYYAYRTSGAAPAARYTIINGRLVRIGSTSSSSPSFARVADVFDPFGFNSRTALRSGVTHMNLVASGYGQALLLRNTPDKPEQMVAAADGVMYATITNSSTSVGLIRSALSASKSSSRSSSPAKTLWNEVKEGKRTLIVNAGNAAGILHLLELLEPHSKVKLVLVASGGNVFLALDKIKKAEPTLILSPAITDRPNSRFPINVPAMVHRLNIPLAFSLSLSQTELSASQDTPLFRAAMLVKSGLPRQAALEALTTGPAKILGLEKTHGSIAAGKMANVLVFDGDPDLLFHPIGEFIEHAADPLLCGAVNPCQQVGRFVFAH